MTFSTIPYNRSYHADILKSFMALQDHEHSVSDSRLSASESVAEGCFEDLKRDCRIKEGEILVGLVDAQFAGFVTYCFESSNNCNEIKDYERYALISNICVMPEFRHQGIGQKLLQAAEAAIKNTGFTGRLRIWSLANNPLSISAYTRFGFIPHEIVFEKKL